MMLLQINKKKKKIHHECEIQELKQSLITIENENLTREILEKEKIRGDALVEKAKAEQKSK